MESTYQGILNYLTKQGVSVSPEALRAKPLEGRVDVYDAESGKLLHQLSDLEDAAPGSSIRTATS